MSPGCLVEGQRRNFTERSRFENNHKVVEQKAIKTLKARLKAFCLPPTKVFRSPLNRLHKTFTNIICSSEDVPVSMNRRIAAISERSIKKIKPELLSLEVCSTVQMLIELWLLIDVLIPSCTQNDISYEHIDRQQNLVSVYRSIAKLAISTSIISEA